MKQNEAPYGTIIHYDVSNGLQEAPGDFKMTLRRAQEEPKRPTGDPRWHPRGSQVSSTCPEMAWRGAKMIPKGAHMGPHCLLSSLRRINNNQQKQNCAHSWFHVLYLRPHETPESRMQHIFISPGGHFSGKRLGKT